MTIMTSGNSMNWEGSDFCNCNLSTPIDPNEIIRDGYTFFLCGSRAKYEIIICKQCNKAIKCEMCNSNQVAMIVHMGYVVCIKHEIDAIDNIESRQW